MPPRARTATPKVSTPASTRRPAPTSRATPKASPGQNPQVEAHLNRLGFTWNFHPEVELEEFDEDLSLRNQARIGNPIDPGTMERYLTAITNGDVLPAIVAAEVPASTRLAIADGNHRYQALKRAGRLKVATYVIVGARPSALTMYTFEANTTHGFPSSEKDRTHQGLYLIASGVAIEEAARRLGVRAPMLRTALQQQQANGRARDTGVDLSRFDRLLQGVRARLNQISTDEGFREMANLTIAAGLSGEQVAKAVSEVNALRSSGKQVAYIRALRGTYADALQTGGANVDRPRRGRQFRSPRAALSMLLGQADLLPTPDAICELMTPEERPEWITRTEGGIARLQAVLDQLKK